LRRPDARVDVDLNLNLNLNATLDIVVDSQVHAGIVVDARQCSTHLAATHKSTPGSRLDDRQRRTRSMTTVELMFTFRSKSKSTPLSERH
jgi:hypothetical protein